MVVFAVGHPEAMNEWSAYDSHRQQIDQIGSSSTEPPTVENICLRR